MATARRTLAGYADAAAAELTLLPDCPARDALSTLVGYVMDRTR
jgi:heptaprenyl diphosphate synthase